MRSSHGYCITREIINIIIILSLGVKKKRGLNEAGKTVIVSYLLIHCGVSLVIARYERKRIQQRASFLLPPSSVFFHIVCLVILLVSSDPERPLTIWDLNSFPQIAAGSSSFIQSLPIQFLFFFTNQRFRRPRFHCGWVFSSSCSSIWVCFEISFSGLYFDYAAEHAESERFGFDYRIQTLSSCPVLLFLLLLFE